MDDLDRERTKRPGDPAGGRRGAREARDEPKPIRRRPSYDEDPGLEPPRRQSRGQRRPDADEPEAPPRRSGRTGEEPEAPGGRYADRFRRQRPYLEAEPDDRSYRSSRDPYDRLRRVGNRPPRRVEPDLEGEFDQYGADDLDLTPAVGRTRRRTARQQAPRVDQQRLREMRSVFARPAPELRALLTGGLVAAASLIVLSILVLVRSGSIDDWFPLYLNAEGTPTVFGTPGAIWRLPFFALSTTIMAFALAWWLRSREAYAVQFLVIGALLIHCLIWVGTITLLW